MGKYLVISKQNDIPVPMDLLKKLLPAQFAYIKAMEQSGKMESSYGIAGGKGGVGIVNAESHADLQTILSGYPMFPFITLDVYPLMSVTESESVAVEMVNRLP